VEIFGAMIEHHIIS